MKKVVSFRLGQPARERLVEMATGRGVSQSRVVEDLILDGPEMVSVEPPTVGPTLTRGATVKLSSGKPGTSSVHRQTIQKPDRPVTQPARRRINPMTGKPFGAVPK